MSRQLTGSSAAAAGVFSNPNAGMHQSGRVAAGGGDGGSGIADSASLAPFFCLVLGLRFWDAATRLAPMMPQFFQTSRCVYGSSAKR
eukprot:CAMPEP_0172853424 /NCGR_PEP_ID=MMETSP1075-20121228/57104_1 /TAXON_ID=2916 /ORGANISM="Ceratium fusus, Strain PA161109" /LENGTH=86 /DNA_ID=CAMNT_0013699915 /DNA_START=5 /DNA_END=265 /DNA_ORIENTATION=+